MARTISETEARKLAAEAVLTEEDEKAWGGRKWIRDEKRAALYELWSWTCGACGRGPRTRLFRDDLAILTLDHLIPRSILTRVEKVAPGTLIEIAPGVTVSSDRPNHEKNLVPLCSTCNSARGNREWRNFYPAGAHIRVEHMIQQPLDMELGRALISSLAGSPVEDAR